MAFRRVGTLLAAVCTLLLATALPAAAHNELKSSNPKAGATVEGPPRTVVLTFSEKLIPGKTNVSVTGPDGANVSGELRLDGPTVSVPLGATQAGVYTVAYNVVADDGDVTDKKFTFTVATAGAAPPATTTTTPAAPPPPTSTTTTVAPTTTPSTTAAPTTPPAQNAAANSDSGTTWWPWLVVGLAVVLAAVVLLILRRRRGTATDGDSDS